ncbi:endonuclease/exonuclease/phosphatase family protein [Lutimaribacter marinistellae]|uniref:Endonuclease/exonuclease/phosphatase family protein n=1 Tax=Lutimaribacter marinistellae TaxID=1820329 RepID=A0ABV7TJU9_9RHOB
MRLATWNVEWFANLFDRDDRLVLDDAPSGREGVSRAQQAEAIAMVLTALDADAVMIIEAPNTGRTQDTVRALESFAKAFDLRARTAVIGFANETHQEIALLYDPAILAARHDPRGEVTGKKGDDDAPRFDGTFRIDLDIDATEDLVRFSKPPLELAITTASGLSFRMIGAHLKSKVPHGAENRDESIRISIANRRKQLAQAIWLRDRVRAHMATGEEVVLLGDLNDGPGLDEFEHLFGRSSVEILLDSGLFDPHADLTRQVRPGVLPTTARFELPESGRYLEALLDYVMLTPGLRDRNATWRIWHPFDDAVCYNTPELRDALLAASDHFPVSVDFDA